LAFAIAAFQARNQANNEKMIALIIIALIVCTDFIQIYPQLPTTQGNQPQPGWPFPRTT
jgi:hypothetical protein